MSKSRDTNVALAGEKNSVLDAKATSNLLSQIMKLWIEPEISRRKQTGTLPENFGINRCLIRLPLDKNPIIEFNEDAGLIVIAKVARGTVKERGDPIFIDEIEEVADICPPEVNGKRVPFIYLRFVRNECKIFFDLNPSLPGGVITEKEGEWKLGDMIVDFEHRILIERVIGSHDRAQALLQEIGLWVAPALLPYPLSRILTQLAKDDAESARKTLIEYCTPELIENLLSK